MWLSLPTLMCADLRMAEGGGWGWVVTRRKSRGGGEGSINGTTLPSPRIIGWLLSNGRKVVRRDDLRVYI